MFTYTIRLKPNQDLFLSIEQLSIDKKIQAGCILTCVGSLQKSALRLANQDNTSTWDNKFEIVSLVGTISRNGSYLHISISDGEGKTIGYPELVIERR
jgi:uncharacterized protein